VKTLALLGTTLGFAFAAGLNLYATVLVIGCGLRFGWLARPASLSGLDVLGHPIVLGAAAVLYVVEFLADKIPAVDHVWDALHTAIRPIGAAWIAWRTVEGGGLPEPIEVVLLLLAGGVALTAHTGKAGTRLAVGATGGHVVGAGIVLSLLEDAAAFILAPLSIVTPFLVLAVVLVAIVAMAWLIPKGVRALRRRGARTPGL